MTEYLFSNFASTIITSAIAADTTAIPLSLGDGDLFPNPAANTAFQAVLSAVDGSMEVVSCTQRTGDTLTVARAQEGTAALAFPVSSRIELRLTAEVCRSFLQRAGGAMAGDLDMAGHAIENARFPDETHFNAGVRAPWIRGLSNAIGIDLNPGRLPMISGSEILTISQVLRCVFPFFGTISQVPYWFKICDGLNGTPDLRGRFIRGTSVRTPGEPAPITSDGLEYAGSDGKGGSKDLRTSAHRLNAGNTVPLVVSKTFKSDVEGGGSATVLADMTIAYAAGDQLHDHEMAEIPNHTHLTRVIPPSMWMFYVMFKGNLIPP